MGNYNETINKTGVNPKTGLGPKMWGSWNTVWTGKPEWKYAPTKGQSEEEGDKRMIAKLEQHLKKQQRVIIF